VNVECYAEQIGDVVQVAVARLSGADLFVTCDEDQHGLASAAGLESCYVHSIATTSK